MSVLRSGYAEGGEEGGAKGRRMDVRRGRADDEGYVDYSTW